MMVGWGSILGRDKRFFTIWQHPDRLWGPPSLLYSGYQGCVPRCNVAGTWNWPLISYLMPSSGMVEPLIEHRDSFTFMVNNFLRIDLCMWPNVMDCNVHFFLSVGGGGEYIFTIQRDLQVSSDWHWYSKQILCKKYGNVVCISMCIFGFHDLNDVLCEWG
jgi:hypothetical protein